MDVNDVNGCNRHKIFDAIYTFFSPVQLELVKVELVKMNATGRDF